MLVVVVVVVVQSHRDQTNSDWQAESGPAYRVLVRRDRNKRVELSAAQCVPEGCKAGRGYLRPKVREA